MTLPEVLLWQRLKGSPQGIAFRKQHPIGPYRADFYCAAEKLAIEVDGAAHDMGDRPARDIARAAWLEKNGYRVIRISAVEVLKDPDEAANAIVAFAANPLRQPLRACHLPMNGEDQNSAGTPKILPVHGEGDRAQRGGGGVPHSDYPNGTGAVPPTKSHP